MRYLPISMVKEGMTVGQDILNGAGEVVLEKDTLLNRESVSQVSHLGFSGIYIEDEFSKDIIAKDVLRLETRKEALKLMYELFHVEIGYIVPKEKIENVVKHIITDVLDHKEIMCNMIDLKTYDEYTFFHSVNVAVLSAALGISCDMNEHDITILTTAALLHDFGQRFVETEILGIRRKLKEEERMLVVQHPKLGYEFLKEHYDFPAYVYSSILQHHEWYNGGGYPMRNSGNDIPIYARIIKLMDVYDALISKRPYREALSPSKAIDYLLANAGGEFDPKLIQLFMKKMAAYPIGCEVILSDGSIALVMENNSEKIDRPKVKVKGSGEIVDLSATEMKEITILKLLL